MTAANVFISSCITIDFWWRAQHLVSWQWRGFAGGVARSDADSPLMVGAAPPTIADIIITAGWSCRCWSCWGSVFFIFPGGGPWCSIWLHLMFWNGDGPSLHDYCIGTAALELSESFPTEESVTALYSWLDMMVWVLLCKWEVEQGGNMRLRMPSYVPHIVGAL